MKKRSINFFDKDLAFHEGFLIIAIFLLHDYDIDFDLHSWDGHET